MYFVCVIAWLFDVAFVCDAASGYLLAVVSLAYCFLWVFVVGLLSSFACFLLYMFIAVALTAGHFRCADSVAVFLVVWMLCFAVLMLWTVMTIFVISVSSDSSEESVGTSTRRVFLFGIIPTTIHDTTPSVIPPSTHIDTNTDILFLIHSEDPSSWSLPPLPATSPFLSSTDDSSNSDTPDTPPSPTHGTPFTEMTLSTQSTPVASGALRRRVMILAPGQPIPHGRPYRYYLNGPVHMMTTRKRVGSLPTHRLAVRHSVDYSYSDHFASDDSSRDSSSSSSSETSSDPSSDNLSDSSSDHSLPAPSAG
ncbi:hypothetical protein Tco_0464625 [Tanacetum coccineum]